MKNIIISIAIGVALLVIGWLLIELGVIKFKTNDKFNDGIILDDNTSLEVTPIYDGDITTVTNETEYVEGNETPTIPAPTPTPTPTPVTPTPTPTPTPTTPATPTPENKPKITVAFEESSYSCNAGEEITTNVYVTNITDVKSSELPGVKSYSSSDKNLATVEKHPNLTAKCLGCVTVLIKCKKAGNPTLTVTYTDGSKAKANVTVAESKPVAHIQFGSPGYACTKGAKITTSITMESLVEDSIVSYTSENTKVATVTKSSAQPKCPGCVGIDINCIGTGTTNLVAQTANGGTATSAVTVNNGKVWFEKSTFTCTEGDTFEFLVRAGRVTEDQDYVPVMVSEVTSSNTKGLSMRKPTMVTECIDCTNYAVTCRKAGSYTLTAKNNLGATATATVQVNAASNSITFSPSSISCSAGKIVSVVIKYNPKLESVYTITDPTIAKAVQSGIQMNDSLSLDISCLKKGTTTLKYTLLNGYEKSLNITVK